MSVIPYVLEENNLSRAWAKLMLKLLTPGITEISPLVLNLNLLNGNVNEIPEIKALADNLLESFNKPTCDTTASTIFPKSLWAPSADRQILYDRYSRILPRLRKCPLNQYGIYFDRLIAHGGEVNQLEHILRTWEKGNHRRSALQALVFDPSKDHTDQRQRGFPCLQSVLFSPSQEGLTVCGVYITQNVFDRAYGNYLGLCRLGEFMAHEMGLPLIKMQCITNFAVLGTPNKMAQGTLVKSLVDLVKASEPSASDENGNLGLEMGGVSLVDDLVLEKEVYAEAR